MSHRCTIAALRLPAGLQSCALVSNPKPVGVRMGHSAVLGGVCDASLACYPVCIALLR
jgi:hypothetical protein